MKISNNINVRSLYPRKNRNKGLDVQALKQMKLNNNNFKQLILGGNEVDQQQQKITTKTLNQDLDLQSSF
jgi:hypothetical protein